MVGLRWPAGQHGVACSTTSIVSRVGGGREEDRKRRGASRTTHLVFAIVLALGAADAEGGRGLGADGIDALESRRGDAVGVAVDVVGGMEVFVVGGDGARAAREGIADGHCDEVTEGRSAGVASG